MTNLLFEVQGINGSFAGLVDSTPLARVAREFRYLMAVTPRNGTSGVGHLTLEDDPYDDRSMAFASFVPKDSLVGMIRGELLLEVPVKGVVYCPVSYARVILPRMDVSVYNSGLQPFDKLPASSFSGIPIEEIYDATRAYEPSGVVSLGYFLKGSQVRLQESLMTLTFAALFRYCVQNKRDQMFIMLEKANLQFWRKKFCIPLVEIANTGYRYPFDDELSYAAMTSHSQIRDCYSQIGCLDKLSWFAGVDVSKSPISFGPEFNFIQGQYGEQVIA